MKYETLQVSSAFFHYQDHSCDSLFVEKGCAIKLYNVRMAQFSDEQKKDDNCIKTAQMRDNKEENN